MQVEETTNSIITPEIEQLVHTPTEEEDQEMIDNWDDEDWDDDEDDDDDDDFGFMSDFNDTTDHIYN